MRDPNWSTNAGAGGDDADLGEAGGNDHPQSRRADLRQAAAARRERRHLCDPDQHRLELSQFGLRRRQLDRDQQHDTEAVVNSCKASPTRSPSSRAHSRPRPCLHSQGSHVLTKIPDVKVSPARPPIQMQPRPGDRADGPEQNPDLCGIVSFSDGIDIGTAAAVKEARPSGQGLVATSGGGERRGACELVKSGAFDLDLSYDVPSRPSRWRAWSMAGLLRRQAGIVKGSMYTTLIPITKENARAKQPAGISATSK